MEQEYRNFKISDLQFTFFRSGWAGEYEGRLVHMPTATTLTKKGKSQHKVREALLRELDALLDLEKEA